MPGRPLHTRSLYHAACNAKCQQHCGTVHYGIAHLFNLIWLGLCWWHAFAYSETMALLSRQGVQRNIVRCHKVGHRSMRHVLRLPFAAPRCWKTSAIKILTHWSFTTPSLQVKVAYNEECRARCFQTENILRKLFSTLTICISLQAKLALRI